MRLSLHLPAVLAILAAPALAGVTMTPMSTFGGGDGWRAPNEILAGDSAGSNNGTNYNYLGTGSLERGIAYNPGFDKLVLVSRNTGVNIRQLDPLSGVDLAPIAIGTGIITGGTFAASMVACGTDGSTYVANLTTNATTAGFKVYQWTDIGDSAPTVIFNSTVTGFSAAARLGDSFDMTEGGGGPVFAAGCGSGVVGYAAISAGSASAVGSFTPTGPLTGEFRLGITFAGAANEVWGRQTAGSGRRTTFSGATGTYLGDLPGIAGSQAGMDYAVVNGLPLLAVLNMANSNVSVYDVTLPGAPALAASGTTTSGALAANANGVGSIKWGAISGGNATLYAMTTNQGLQAFNVTVTANVTPPSIVSSPGNRSAYERGQTTFTVSVTGTPSFNYQWYHGVDLIPGATAANYTINPITAASAGDYTCRVSNAAPGFVESTSASLTVLPGVNTAALTECWHLAPGSRPYLTGGGDTERGVDYNPATNRLYFASRNPAAQLYVLDGTTNADLGQLNMTGVSGGTFAIMFPGIAGDGIIYACNLSNTGDGGSFKIYQWPDDNPATAPATVYDGNPIGSRIGDSFDVRGSGAGTECVAGARNTNQFVLFKPDGPGFLTASTVTVTDALGGAFGLGIAFGQGNTVWGKNGGGQLVYCSYDPAAGTGSVIASYGAAAGITNTTNPLGVDSVNRCLAMIEIGNSDNVRFFSYSGDASPALTLLDQEFLPTDNVNGNGIGSVYVGAGKVYALDTNNGLACYSTLKPALPTLGAITPGPAGSFSVQINGTPGFSYVVETSSDLTAPSWVPFQTIPFVNPTETAVLPMSTNRSFYRTRLGP